MAVNPIILLENVNKWFGDLHVLQDVNLSVDKKERIGRNPKTGESVYVNAKKVAMFKSGKGLRDRLNFKP